MNAVYIRLALYVVSSMLGMIPASLAGYVSYDATTYALTIDVQAVVIAIFAGFAMSAGVLNRWGVK